jgi:hypothetical protein
MDMVHVQGGREEQALPPLFFGILGQIMRVGSLAEEKDWGCGRETLWFSRTTVNQPSGSIRKRTKPFQMDKE